MHNSSWSLRGSLVLLTGVALFVCWPQGNPQPEAPRGALAPGVQPATERPVDAVVSVAEPRATRARSLQTNFGDEIDPVARLVRVLDLADDPCSGATRELIAIYLEETTPLVRAACADALEQRELTPEQAFQIRVVERPATSE